MAKMSSGKKKSATANVAEGATFEVIQARLLAHYRTAFQCEYDMTPWGARWPALLADALSVEIEFKKAIALLRRLASAIEGVQAHARRLTLQNADGAAALSPVGPTVADKTIAHLTSSNTISLDLLRYLTTTMVHVHSAPIHDAFMAAHHFGIDVVAVLSAPRDVDVEDAGVRRREMLYRRHMYYAPGASRRVLRRPRADGTDGADSPAIIGPILPTTSADNFRRPYLVGLLDEYPMPRPNAPALWSVPSNTDIAVVSLLTGGLEERRGEIPNGWKFVISAERHTIAFSRRRCWAWHSQLIRKREGISLAEYFGAMEAAGGDLDKRADIIAKLRARKGRKGIRAYE